MFDAWLDSSIGSQSYDQPCENHANHHYNENCVKKKKRTKSKKSKKKTASGSNPHIRHDITVVHKG